MIRGKIQFAHLPWIILFFSLLSIHFKGQSDIVEINMANTFRIFMVGLAGLISVLIIMVHKNGIRNLLSIPIGCLLLYGLVGVVSGSYATVGLYAVWKSIEVIVDVLAIAAVVSTAAQRKSLSGLYGVVMVLFTLLVVSVLVGALAMPGKAFSPVRGLIHIQLSGLIPPINPNGVAFICAFVGLVSFIRFLQDSKISRRFFYACLFSASFAMLILAQSRTSLVGFVFAVVAFLFFDKRRKLLTVAIGIIVFALSIESTIEFLQREQSKGLAMSFSGRTTAWKASWELFKKSPYIGSGFASAGRFDILKGGVTSTLHGSIFDVLAGVGLLGLIPWLTAIAYTCIRLVFPRGRPRDRLRTSIERGTRAELIAVMVLIIFRVTTSSGLALHDPTFLLFLVLLAFSVAPEVTVYQTTHPGQELTYASNPGT